MKYTSLIFLLLLILVIYFNHKNVNRLTIWTLVLFLFYILVCQQYYEHFDKSLEHLDNYSRNPEKNKQLANQLFKNKLFDVDTCYKELIKNTVLDNFKSFYIKNNNDFLTFDIDLNNNGYGNVYLIKNKPTTIYPPTRFYINYINNFLNRVSENEYICTFNIYALVDKKEYYLEYNYENETVLPTLNSGGTKQTWILKFNKKTKTFNIKTLDGRFLAKGNTKYNDNNIVLIKNLEDNTCNWKLQGIEKSTCKKNNQKLTSKDKCCSYLIEKDGKCIFPNDLPFHRNYGAEKNSPLSEGKQGVWMPQFNKIWNGYYSSFLTTLNNYNDKNQAIKIELDNFKVNNMFSKGKITVPIPDDIKKPKVFNINTIGSNLLSGESLDKEYEIFVRMIPKDKIKDLFNHDLQIIDLKTKKKEMKNIYNSVIINVLVKKKNKVKSLMTLSDNSFKILNMYSFKMTDYNMEKDFISIFEAINSIDKTLL